ncbi:hypothetical protein [Abyssalbus ytuae]|uniref:Uncharacterized protein n=1 Tax=Abyssalbus ytuae TaxID=2926907 RepID=A0A9E7D208_9FLAO|nr:hypothetical protein [Abyssalbus ytuae]UOB17663.1 hypothetical protein MQE35_18220 [Abyssalbus ytuae]
MGIGKENGLRGFPVSHPENKMGNKVLFASHPENKMSNKVLFVSHPEKKISYGNFP